MPNLRRVGQEAEDRAAQYLLDKGYTIVTRRYATRSGELDIVALDGETLVFVEVKERRAPGWLPEDGVGNVKIGRWRAAAEDYLIRMEQLGRSIRFDVIAIDAHGIRHHQDAID